MSLLIREADSRDAALIAELSRTTFYDTFASANTPENMEYFMQEVFTKEKLMNEVGAAGNYFLLAFEGETPVGYVRMRDGEEYAAFEGKPSLEIARIYATAASIGKGVGKELMKKCLAIAAEMQRKIIWLGVWEHNQRAIDFYTKWGFVKFDTHVFQLGDDPQTDWLMMKDI